MKKSITIPNTLWQIYFANYKGDNFSEWFTGLAVIGAMNYDNISKKNSNEIELMQQMKKKDQEIEKLQFTINKLKEKKKNKIKAVYEVGEAYEGLRRIE